MACDRWPPCVSVLGSFLKCGAVQPHHAVALETRPARAPFHGAFQGLGVGDPGMTRTCDLRFRKPSLYPAELRDRVAAPRKHGPLLVPYQSARIIATLHPFKSDGAVPQGRSIGDRFWRSRICGSGRHCPLHAGGRRPSLIIRAICSPISTEVRWFARQSDGKIDASATRRPDRHCVISSRALQSWLMRGERAQRVSRVLKVMPSCCTRSKFGGRTLRAVEKCSDTGNNESEICHRN